MINNIVLLHQKYVKRVNSWRKNIINENKNNKNNKK
jgi:hypothetical protein